MRSFPPIVKQYIDSLETCRYFAYLHVSSQGRLMSQGGALDRYYIKPLNKSTEVVKRLPFLEGFFTLSHGDVLPYVQITAGIYADIHMVKDEDTFWVILVDLTPEALEKRKVQQILSSAKLKNT